MRSLDRIYWVISVVVYSKHCSRPQNGILTHIIWLHGFTKGPQPSILFCHCAVLNVPSPTHPPPSPLVPPIPYSPPPAGPPSTHQCVPVSMSPQGDAPSLSPSGPFWLRSTPCLPNHLGAGYGDELLTTAGQPVPHNPRPSLPPPPRPAVDSSPWQWGRNLFSLMCPLPASSPPSLLLLHHHHRLLFILSASERPMKRQQEGSHMVRKRCCHCLEREKKKKKKRKGPWGK